MKMHLKYRNSGHSLLEVYTWSWSFEYGFYLLSRIFFCLQRPFATILKLSSESCFVFKACYWQLCCNLLAMLENFDNLILGFASVFHESSAYTLYLVCWCDFFLWPVVQVTFQLVLSCMPCHVLLNFLPSRTAGQKKGLIANIFL